MRNDKDFKPCHGHGAESKHSYDECKRNPKKQASLVTMLKNVDTMRITTTIDIAAVGSIPQVNATRPFRATGKSTTS